MSAVSQKVQVIVDRQDLAEAFAKAGLMTHFLWDESQTFNAGHKVAQVGIESMARGIRTVLMITNPQYMGVFYRARAAFNALEGVLPLDPALRKSKKPAEELKSGNLPKVMDAFVGEGFWYQPADEVYAPPAEKVDKLALIAEQIGGASKPRRKREKKGKSPQKLL